MMSQLRNSGTRSLHATEPVPSAEMDGFCRIFGVETRYGVAVTGTEHPVNAGQVVMAMFQPIVSHSRSTDTYLANGSRLHLDVGSHSEYVTVEARDPREVLAQDLIDEHVMRNPVLKARYKLRESHGIYVMTHVFKNNVDSAGHTFGCHGSYLVHRFVPLETIEYQLLPFLITRQLYTGTDRVTSDGLQIVRRMDFLDEAVLSATTRSRPMVNTHDELYTGPDSFRRLHVVIDDSNRPQWFTWIKFAVTYLVLCAIEDTFRHGVPSGFGWYAFADPAAANHTISRLLDNPRAELVLESNESVSASGLQRRYYTAVGAFIEIHGDTLAGLLPATMIDIIMGEWSRVLDALERGAYDALTDHVNRAVKKRLFDVFKRRRSDVTFAQMERLELNYHDIADGRLYGSLVAHSQVRELLTGDNVEYAVHNPLTDTHVALRDRFADAALNVGAQFSANWTHLTLIALECWKAIFPDPFGVEPTSGFGQLMETLNQSGIIRLDDTSQHHNKKTPAISVGVFVVSNTRSNCYEQKVIR